jgi:hypothetical protein
MGYQCQLRQQTSASAGPARSITVQPEADGGGDLANLRAVCVRCHAKRTGRQGALAGGALPDDLEATGNELQPNRTW